MFNSKKIKYLEEQIIQLQNRIEEEFYYTSKSPNPLFGIRVKEVKNIFKLYISNRDLKWFGNQGDGGYLLVNDLSKTDLIISGGIGFNDTFEKDIAQCVKSIVMFDHAIANYSTPLDNCIYFPFKISDISNSNSVSIDQIINDFPADDYILKLDIEGDEWNIIDVIEPSTLRTFRQIIIEFHNIDRKIQFDYAKLIRVFHKLNENHSPVSIHANNHGRYVYLGDDSFPQTLEVTYARKGSYELTLANKLVFHPKQRKNAAEYEEFMLW